MENIFIGIRDNSFLDIMSLTHFLSGLGLGLIFVIFRNTFKKIYFSLGIILLIVWEIFEFFLRFLRVYYPLFLEELKFIPTGWSANESALNIVSDLIVGFIGLLIIHLIFKKYVRKNKLSS